MSSLSIRIKPNVDPNLKPSVLIGDDSLHQIDKQSYQLFIGMQTYFGDKSFIEYVCLGQGKTDLYNLFFDVKNNKKTCCGIESRWISNGLSANLNYWFCDKCKKEVL